MPRPRMSRSPYVYPEHLRGQLQELPRGPGVYLFYGDNYTMPLYIGKSLNIRSRVMTHLRNKDEARLLRQSRRIEYHCTAGDLGAQLLEAQLIKQLQPLYNRRLRKQRRLYTLHLQDGIPQVIETKTLATDAAHPPFFGLFSHRKAAAETLMAIADTHGLCYHRLGIASWERNGACFRVALGRCRGVCCGQELPDVHDLRLRQALEGWRINIWPYPGPIGIIETSADLQQIHVVDQWHYLGSASTEAQAQQLVVPAPSFDRDLYRILCPTLLKETHSVIPLTCSH